MGEREGGEQRWIQIYLWVAAAKASNHGVRFTGANSYNKFRLLPAVREE